MFKVGDYIICGSNGVCKVEGIGSDVPGAQEGRNYYTLASVYQKGKVIYTPVDNEKVIMRPILKKDEAVQLIEEIKDIDMLWINDERKREEAYKEALRSCDCRQLVAIIKNLYTRRQERIAAGKKNITNDERYFKLAEDVLYEELAISLGISKEEVREHIVEVASRE
ncbi:MAG: CarD family transcriptional regulator [Lachnospiraceae bacterium]|nr:CarD family transcriptional regulator [Lachnospiraceae bacterium]